MARSNLRLVTPASVDGTVRPPPRCKRNAELRSVFACRFCSKAKTDIALIAEIGFGSCNHLVFAALCAVQACSQHVMRRQSTRQAGFCDSVGVPPGPIA
jgi:hypothetical protein